MKPDFIIISSRMKNILRKRFEEVAQNESTAYISFFPSVEKEILEVFAEGNLVLNYRGKSSPVFPTNVLWGNESNFEEGIISKNGEIDVIEKDSGKKIAVLRVSFSYGKDLFLLEKPDFFIKEL